MPLSALSRAAQRSVRVAAAFSESPPGADASGRISEIVHELCQITMVN